MALEPKGHLYDAARGKGVRAGRRGKRALRSPVGMRCRPLLSAPVGFDHRRTTCRSIGLPLPQQVIKEFAIVQKKQQMRWSPARGHYLLQVPAELEL